MPEVISEISTIPGLESGLKSIREIPAGNSRDKARSSGNGLSERVSLPDVSGKQLQTLLRWILDPGSTPDLARFPELLKYRHLLDPINRQRIQSERMQNQVRMLQKIQNLEQSSSLAVSRSFAHGRIVVNGLTVPAIEISGDAHDVFLDSTSAVWVCLVDAAGKGLAPGFFAQHILGLIRRHASTLNDAFHLKLRDRDSSYDPENPSSVETPGSLPAIAMHAAGTEIASLGINLFATAVAIRITPDGSFSWSSAGIRPVVTDRAGSVLRPGKREIRISGWPPPDMRPEMQLSEKPSSITWQETTYPLNLLPDRPPRVSRCAGILKPGDCVYLLSDGVTDRWHSNLPLVLQWCADREAGLSPKILCGDTTHSWNLRGLSRPPRGERDDMTALSIRWSE